MKRIIHRLIIPAVLAGMSIGATAQGTGGGSNSHGAATAGPTHEGEPASSATGSKAMKHHKTMKRDLGASSATMPGATGASGTSATQ